LVRSPFVVCVSAFAAIVLACSSFESGADSTPSPDASAPNDAATADEAPTAVVDSAACGGANVAVDPKNCGRCGRDCGQGACDNGECTPYKVKCDAPSAPYYLAVDDSHVFWTSRSFFGGDDYIHRRPKDDLTAANERIGQKLEGVFAIALSASNIFVTVADSKPLAGLRMYAKDGSMETSKQGGNAVDLALTPTGDRVYFTNEAVRWVLSNNQDPGVNTIRNNVNLGEGIAVDSTHVYWTIHAQPSDGGAVWRALLNDGDNAGEVFVGNLAYPRRLTLADDALYVVNSSNLETAIGPIRSGSVVRKLKGGGVIDLMTDAKTGRGGIVVDERFAYVTLEEGGQVVRVNKTNGLERRVVQEGLDRPIGIAKDATSLWFGETGTGCLWRMTR